MIFCFAIRLALIASKLCEVLETGFTFVSEVTLLHKIINLIWMRLHVAQYTLPSLAFLLSLVNVGNAACREDVVSIRGDFGEARFTIEIADDPNERAVGLMNRIEMATSAGMLFVYPKPQSISFWMKNTLIELDMIFVDPTGVVQYVHHRARPLDETSIVGGSGLSHVLEINGGVSKLLGIGVGDQLQHSSFNQTEAYWPC